MDVPLVEAVKGKLMNYDFDGGNCWGSSAESKTLRAIELHD